MPVKRVWDEFVAVATDDDGDTFTATTIDGLTLRFDAERFAELLRSQWTTAEFAGKQSGNPWHDEVGRFAPVPGAAAFEAGKQSGNPWHDEIGRFAPKGTGTQAGAPDGAVVTDDPRAAATAVLTGTPVVTDQGPVVDIMNEFAAADAPVDLTLLTVQGTAGMYSAMRANGRPRDTMPQIPEERMDHFLTTLQADGFTAETFKADPRNLLATQSELDGRKSGQIMQAIQAGKLREGNPIIVSSDGHILDGHHRWAGAAAAATRDGSVRLPALKVNMPIDQLLAYANAYNDATGIRRKKMGEAMPRADSAEFAPQKRSLKGDVWLVGMPCTSEVDVAGEGLPYMAHFPFLAFAELVAVEPSDMAAVAAGLTVPADVTAAAKTSLTASNPLRRAVLMDTGSRELLDAYRAVTGALDAAQEVGTLKWREYPLAVQVGDIPVADVKALKGTAMTFSGLVLVSSAGEVIPVGDTALPADDPDVVTVEDEAPAEAVAAAAGTPVVRFADDPLLRAERLGGDTANMVPWEGVLIVEGVEAGDGRIIDVGALTWRDLPLPLMSMFANPDGGDGHAGALLVGRIDRIWRDEANEAVIRSAGVIDRALEPGAVAVQMLATGMMRGISADIDRVIGEWSSPDLEGFVPPDLVHEGRIMGGTLCPFPAFQEAAVSLTASAAWDDRLTCMTAATATVFGDAARITWEVPVMVDALVAAAAIPERPPAAWFEYRDLAGPTMFTVEPDGQVYGHVALWDLPHIGFRHEVRPPKSKAGYRHFLTGRTMTAEGEWVSTGPIVMDTVHPDLAMRASDAQTFYAHTGAAIGDVAVYEDRWGIAVFGAARPTITAAQMRAVNGADGVSPDWRPIGGALELCAMLVVNNSGFKVPARVHQALAASAGSGVAYTLPGVYAGRVVHGRIEAMVGTGRLSRAVVERGRHTMQLAAAQARVDQLEARLAALEAHTVPSRRQAARERLAAILGG